MFQKAWSSGVPLLALPEKPWEELTVSHAALHMWEEHCVECAPPDCYTSCSLFEKRADLKCARFVHGIVERSDTSGVEGHGYEIHFRRWAKLETKLPEFPEPFPVRDVRRLAVRLNRMERLARYAADALAPVQTSRKIQGAQYAYHQMVFPRWASIDHREFFDGFFMEFFSPESASFTLEIAAEKGVVLRHKLKVTSGWNRSFIHREFWPPDLPGGALIRLVNNEDRKVSMVITALHLVRWEDAEKAALAFDVSVSEPSQSLPKIKCVVFDLDNTLWTGVIGDDGPEHVQIRKEAVDFIHALDERGIICAVASKNEFDIAWKKIDAIGLSEHLLFPQIHWGPKSESVLSIAQSMNVHLNTLAFVDDNPFERREVKTRHPMVRVYPETGLMALLEEEGFKVPITPQAQKRRLSYLAESKRVHSRSASAQSVDQFLRSCNMKLSFLDPRQHVDRCLEMIDRTNQFNISGQRYSEDEFRDMLESDSHFCWSIRDDYGDYGIVGYLRATNDAGHWLITDFVMSCRVAQKRVEEALFHSLRSRLPTPVNTIALRLVETQRNQAIIQKLQELGDKLESGDVLLHECLPGSDVIDVLN